MNKSELQKHVAEAYSTAPDFPWESTPEPLYTVMKTTASGLPL